MYTYDINASIQRGKKHLTETDCSLCAHFIDVVVKIFVRHFLFL